MNRKRWLITFLALTVITGFSFGESGEGLSNKPFQRVACPSSSDNPRNSEGDIVELKDGTLLLAWSRFSGSADHAQAVIAAKKSRDRGRSWSEEFILQKNTGKQNVMSVSFLRLQSGKILFFFLQKNSSSDLQLYIRESVDEAKTWSPAKRVTKGPGYHIMNNARAVQLHDGRILTPIAYAPDIRKDYNGQVCFCYRSDDDGKNWMKCPQEIRLDNTAAMEPGIVERADRSLLMIIRTKLNRIYHCISHDRGDHWTSAKPMELTAPAAPATIARIPSSGDLLIIWNNNPLGNEAGWRGRSPLTAAISQDGGKHWKPVKNIADDPESAYAYTSITFTGKRALLTYYHWKKGKSNFEGTDTVFHSIPIRWFYQD